MSPGECWPSVLQSAALTVVLVVTVPIVVLAQAFQPPEQFMNLSFGTVRTSITPPDFVWTDDKFPRLVLPRRDSDGAMELSVGAMVANRLAIVGGIGLLGGSGDVRVAPIHLYGGVRRWITGRAWVEGGIGPTVVRVFQGEGETQVDSGNWGVGLLGVVGYDLIQRRNPSFVTRGHFVAHAQARIHANAAGGVRANTVALLIGFAVGY